MNLAKVIADALRGHAPQQRERQRGGADSSPPGEFLRLEVWPRLREAREALEARGFTAVAAQPSPDDETHSYALLILESCQHRNDACFLRFCVLGGQLHAKMKHPSRSDTEAVPLDPPGSVILVQDIIEDFIYHCLAPARKTPGAPPKPTGDSGREKSCNGEITAAGVRWPAALRLTQRTGTLAKT